MKPEELDRYMQLFKRINEMLKEEGKKEISQDSISKFVTDKNRQKTHEKALEIKEKRLQQQKAIHEAKESLGTKEKVPVSMLDRAAMFEMDISGTEEAKEHNKELVLKFQDKQFCFDYITKTLGQLKDLDWEKEYSEKTSIKALVDSHDNHYQLDNLAFICINEGHLLDNANMFNPDLKSLFDKMPLLQGINSTASSFELAGNPLYTMLPDDAFSIDVVSTLMGRCDELQEEFSDILDKDVFKLANIGPLVQCGSDVISTLNIAKAVNTGKLPANYLMEYRFTKDGKEVPMPEIVDVFTNGKSIDEYKLVKEDKETIERQNKALSESVFGSREDYAKVPLENNPGMQRLLGENICKIVGVDGSKVKESVYDKDKQRQHEAALKLKEHEKKQREIMNEVCKELGIKSEAGQQARLVATYIDTSGTEQAKKNNEELMKKASTKEGLMEINNKAVKEILSLDIKDIYSKENTLESYLENSIANNDRNRRCYVLASLSASNEIDYRLKDVFEYNMSFLEYQESENVASLMASPLYKCIPNEVLNNPAACEKLVKNLPQIMEAFQKADPSIDIGQINVDVCDMVSVANYLTNNMAATMIKEGKVSTEKLLNGRFILEGNENAKYADLDEAYRAGNKDKIKYVEFSETKKKEIKEALKGDIIITTEKQSEQLKEYIDPIANPAPGQGIIGKADDFKKTHSIFSRDTRQFKEMEESLKKVSDLAKQYNDPKRTLSKTSKLGMDLKEAIAELKEKATTYRDKKQNEKDTQKKFSTRSQNRLDIANKLLDDIDKTMTIEEPTKSADNPFRKKLSDERQQKLDNDTKEKVVVEEKTRVKNEPVKEVSLEQGDK